MRRYLTFSFCLTALLVAAQFGDAHAQNEPVAKPRTQPVPATIEYRRIYAPLNAIDKWPTDGQSYVPVLGEEFEQRIKALNESIHQAPAAARAMVRESTWRARLQGDTLQGTCEWRVAVEESTDTLLRLGTTNLALHDLAWRKRGRKAGENDVDQSARLNCGTDARGELLAIVDRSGVIEGNWSLHGRREQQNQLSFQLQLPAATEHRFLLDLPLSVVPVAAGAIVELVPTAAELAGRSVWRVRAGGQSQLLLRIVPKNAPREELPRSSIEQSTTYEFSPRGLTIDVELAPRSGTGGARWLECEIDDRLQPIWARTGKTELPWSVIAGDATAPPRLRVDLTRFDSKSSSPIQLRLLAALPKQEAAPLPGVFIDDQMWRQGSITLLVPRPLLIEQLQTAGAIQTRRESFPGMKSGEVIRLQAFEPRATVSVGLGSAATRPKIFTATRYEFSQRDVSATKVATFEATAGEQFQLEAEVGNDWLIESVTSDPPGAVADWTRIESDSVAGPGGESTTARGKLTIQLAKALVSGRLLRLVVVGRWQRSPLNESLDYQSLRFVTFTRVSRTSGLVHLIAEPKLELRVDNIDEANRRAIDSLSPLEVELLDEPTGGVLLELDEATNQAVHFELTRGEPRFRAQIDCELIAGDETLREQYVVRCDPVASDVQTLRIQLSRSSDSPLGWYEETEEGPRPLTSRKLGPLEQAALNLDSQGEAWLIELDRARSTEFQIVGTRRAPFQNRVPITLVSVVNATEQEGRVAIRADGSRTPSIVNRGLRPIANPPGSSSGRSQPLARFRYDPSTDVNEATAPLTIAPGEDLIPEAFAWKALLDSRYSIDGPARHRLGMAFRRTARGFCTVTLPEGATWLSARVNDQEAVAQAADGTRAWRINFAPGDELVRLVIDFQTSESTLASGEPLRCPLPDFDLPIVDAEWRVWTPLAYVVSDPMSDVVSPVDRGWRERLFGPLGRPARSGIFNPLVGRDWREFAASDTELSTVSRRAIGWLNGLQQTLVNNNSTRLGDLLVELAESDPSEVPVFVIDGKALRDDSIHATATITLPQKAEKPRQALVFLERHGLALVVLPDGVMLTTSTRLAQWRDELVELAAGRVAWLPAGSALFRSNESVSQWGRRLGLVTPATWNNSVAEVASISRLPTVRLDREATASYVRSRGWNVAILPIDQAGTTIARVTNVDEWRMLAWGLWLIASVAFYWLMPARWTWWIAVLVGSGALALYLPSQSSRLATAILLGAIAGLVARWLLRQPWRFGEPQDETTKVIDGSTQRAAIAALSIVALLMCVVASPIANASAATPTPPPVYRVFVPIDDEDQPTGDKYFIPQAMFRQLFRPATTPASQTPPLLTAASYRGKLAFDATRQRMRFEEFSIEIQIHTFSTNTPVRLPLEQLELDIDLASVTVDGQPVKSQWNEGRGLEVVIADAGSHWMSLSGIPKIEQQQRRQAIGFRIPRIANAQLVLTLPTDAPAIELASSAGVSRFDELTGRFMAQLGASERLSASWQVQSARGNETAQADGSQLTMLRMRTGSVVVESWLKLQLGDRRMERLRLAIDPRLRLLPEESATPRYQVIATPEREGEVELAFEPPIIGEEVIRLKFLLADATGIGRLPLPRIEPQGIRLLDRYVALYVDPSLEAEAELVESIRPMTTQTLARIWPFGEAEPPETAFQFPVSPVDWRVVVRPRATRTKGTAEMALRYQERQVVCDYQSKLTTRDGHLFQQRLAVPQELIMDDVSVRQDETELVERWSLANDGTLTLFFTGPVMGEYQLTMRGRLAVNVATAAVPRFQMLDADVALTAVNIYRSPGVIVTVTPGAQYQSITRTAATNGSAAERLVARLVPKPIEPAENVEDQRLGTVQVTPNQPQLGMVEVTTVTRVANRWVATVDLRCHVRDGVLDYLRLRVPRAWCYEIEVPEAFSHVLVDLPGGLDQMLLITPATPLQDKSELSITLHRAPGLRDRVRAPLVEPLQTDQLVRYVLLPKFLDLRQVEWEIEGLREEPIPRQEETPPVASESYWQYRVISDSSAALLKSVERVSGVAQIWLMDVEIVAHEHSNRITGRIRYDLAPAGLTSCLLRVPEGVNILEITIDGTDASLRKEEDQLLQINLASDQLTQCIEVVVEAAAMEQPWFKIAVPALWNKQRPIDVERTLWTVHGSAQLQRLDANELLSAEDRPTAIDLQSERVSNLGLLLGIRRPEESPLPPSGWLARWDQRFAAERARSEAVRQQGAITQPPSEQLATLIETVTNQRAELPALSEDERDASAQLLGRDSALSLMLNGHEESGPVVRAMFRGDVTRLLAARTTVAPPRDTARILIGLALVSLGACLMWFRQQIDIGDALLRWPHAWGVVIGLLFWLFLWPSFFGLLILFTSLSLALLPHWPRAREEGSTIMSSRE